MCLLDWSEVQTKGAKAVKTKSITREIGDLLSAVRDASRRRQTTMDAALSRHVPKRRWRKRIGNHPDETEAPVLAECAKALYVCRPLERKLARLKGAGGQP